MYETMTTDKQRTTTARMKADMRANAAAPIKHTPMLITLMTDANRKRHQRPSGKAPSIK